MSKKNKSSQFQQIVDGVCPHCGSTLTTPESGRGIGQTRRCQRGQKCGHRWYYNTAIKTSKCLTCAQGKLRKS